MLTIVAATSGAEAAAGELARAQERAAHVDGEDAVELGDRQVGGHRVREDAGVVDEDVDVAGAVEQRRDRGLVGDVDLDGLGAANRPAGSRAACALAPSASRSATTTLAPASARRVGDRRTEALRRAGDDRRAAARATAGRRAASVTSCRLGRGRSYTARSCRCGCARTTGVAVVGPRTSARATGSPALEHRPQSGTVGEDADVVVGLAVDEEHVGELARRQGPDVGAVAGCRPGGVAGHAQQRVVVVHARGARRTARAHGCATGRRA